MAAILHMKDENGIRFPASSYAYVGDPNKVTTWKVRLDETPGKMTVHQLGLAAASLSSGGLMGNPLQVPETAKAEIAKKIRQGYVKLGVDKADWPEEIKESSIGRIYISLRESSIELSSPYDSESPDATLLPAGVSGISPDSVLLKAGLNKTKRRMYTPEFIKKHMNRFDGAFSSVNHPGKDEEKNRPERNVNDIAAVVHNPSWDETRQAAVGDIHYLNNSAGREMKDTYKNDTLRKRAGLSIYWPGDVKMSKTRIAEGNRLVDVPEELIGNPDAKFDVDFVTRPSAGGQVSNILKESEDMLIEDLTLEDLIAERPDLIEAARDTSEKAQIVKDDEEKIKKEKEDEDKAAEELAKLLKAGEKKGHLEEDASDDGDLQMPDLGEKCPLCGMIMTDDEQNATDCNTSEADTNESVTEESLEDLKAEIRRLKAEKMIASKLDEAELPLEARQLVEADIDYDTNELESKIDNKIKAVQAVLNSVVTKKLVTKVHMPSESIMEAGRKIDVMADIKRNAGEK